MKGVIFNILEEIVTEHHGPDMWDELLDRANVDGAYTSLGSYADDEFFALAGHYCGLVGHDMATCLGHIGRAMLPHLAALYPEAVEQYPDTLRMLYALNEVIHPEVTKLYPGAIVPVFRCHGVDSSHIVLEYDSPRRLCSLAHGLMLGVGEKFDQPVSVEQSECLHSGDERCLFTVTLHSEAS